MLLDPHTARPVAEQARPVARTLRGESVVAEEYLLAISSQGGATPCLISTAPLRMHGDITAVVYVIEDITAWKEADQAKDEFLAVLAHELQTPLTSMLGWSSLALDKDTHAFYRQAMEVVYRNAARQKSLVGDILDMSRLLHRKTELTLVLTDLRGHVEQALENIQQEAAAKGLTLQLEMPPDPLTLQLDITRFQQCLDNLLHNSLKFTPRGGRITVAGGDRARMPTSPFTIAAAGWRRTCFRSFFCPTVRSIAMSRPAAWAWDWPLPAASWS